MSLDFTLGITYFVFFLFINVLFFIFLKNLFFKIIKKKKILLFLSVTNGKKKLLFGFLYFCKFNEIKNFSVVLLNFQKISKEEIIKDIFLIEIISFMFQGYYLDLFKRQVITK